MREAHDEELLGARLDAAVGAAIAAQLAPPELDLWPMSRSTIWRVLDEADLEPHKAEIRRFWSQSSW